MSWLLEAEWLPDCYPKSGNRALGCGMDMYMTPLYLPACAGSSTATYLADGYVCLDGADYRLEEATPPFWLVLRVWARAEVRPWTVFGACPSLTLRPAVVMYC